jgi:hypothetical protein
MAPMRLADRLRNLPNIRKDGKCEYFYIWESLRDEAAAALDRTEALEQALTVLDIAAFASWLERFADSIERVYGEDSPHCQQVCGARVKAGQLKALLALIAPPEKTEEPR